MHVAYEWLSGRWNESAGCLTSDRFEIRWLVLVAFVPINEWIFWWERIGSMVSSLSWTDLKYYDHYTIPI
jgi:hypothetical protein